MLKHQTSCSSVHQLRFSFRARYFNLELLTGSVNAMNSFDKVATKPRRAVMAGGGVEPSSDSNHTPASYMNKPEKERGADGARRREIFAQRVNGECHMSAVRRAPRVRWQVCRVFPREHTDSPYCRGKANRLEAGRVRSEA